jgi:signal transduction histidine kinase/CheY-like chemotaxis protein
VRALRHIGVRALVYLACALGTLGIFQPVLAEPVGLPLLTRIEVPEITAHGPSWAAAQTPDGILHFGARDLVSFDGERWTTTSVGAGYGIRSLDAAADGKLWAAAVGDLGWFGRDGGEFHSLLSHIPAQEQPLGIVWHVFATPDGATFVTEDKILCWDGRAFRIWRMSGTRHLRAVRAGGRIFVQHKPTGIYEMTATGPTMFLSAAIAGDAGIFLVERTNRGWTIVTSDGVSSWDGTSFTRAAGNASDYIEKHTLTLALRLPDGRLALGTTDDGLRFVSPDGDVERTRNELGGDDLYITALALDRQNGLWAASSSAVYRIALVSPSSVFDRRSQLAARAALSIARDASGIGILTSDQFYRIDADGRNLSGATFAGAPFISAQASATGTLVGGFHHLSRLRGDDASVVHRSDHDIYAISPGVDGVHYFIDGRDIGSISANDVVRILYRDLPDYATSVAADRRGDLWVGTQASGVFKVGFSSTPPALLPIDANVGIAAAKGKSHVAISAQGEIVVFNGAGAWAGGRSGELFTPVRGFPAGFTVQMCPALDSLGNVWTVAESSDARSYVVGRVAFTNGTAVWQPHSAEGLSAIGVPSCIFVEESAAQPMRLWVGGSSGVLRNELARGISAPRPEPPLLHAFVKSPVGRTAISAALPYSTPSIDFEFAAPDFVRRPLLRLQTRIDGIDADWVPAGPDSRRQLTALRDGNYTFRVRAVAETGVTSEATTFAFSVAPPWWRTAPALLGVVFALVPFGYGVYRLRLQALRRRTLELEAKVRQRTEQLEQANAAKTQFVANMSHDIRNPLNGIVGLALALEDSRLDTHQREIVATLRECTTYLSSLVDDVLDFASIEAGRVELRPGPFVPSELLGSIVTTTKTDTAESGARLIVDVDPALPGILSGDAGRIQQILVNYVSNALKYAGGTITLTATIPIGTADEIEFSVADEGPGISAAEQATLFTKFTRLSGARDHDIPGAGLGLAACRLLADIMGGSVGVVSEPGHGARFFLRLPLTRAEIPVPPAEGELPNTTVLLVEDTDYNALAATAVLRRLGLNCERARTGAEALQLFAAKRYNIVLLDRNLPDMDGTEIARKMRAMESDGLQSILLAVTAYCTADDRRLCLEAGMDAFVGKPLTPEKLRKILVAAGRRMLTAASFDVTPEPAAPELDLSMLTYLAEPGDGGLDTQVRRFLASLGEQEAQLKSAATGSLPELGSAAHRVLGQARMVGAAALSAAATELQEAAQGGDPARCAAAYPRVLGEIAALTVALRHRRSGALTT